METAEDIQHDATIPSGLSETFLTTDPSGANSSQAMQWSYPPHFTDNLTAFNGPLGVYNVADVGLGVAVFTTPALAPLIYARLHSHAVPLDLSGLKLESPGNRATSNKGKLVRATRAFKRGEIVVTELPIIVGLAEQELSWPHREALLKIAVERLPHESQNLVTSLSAGRFQEQGLFLCGIMATHAGSMVLVEGSPHFALYPQTIALFNHDCGPNLQFRNDPETLAITIRAARDIMVGEELSISSFNIDPERRPVHFMPAAERRVHTRDHFGWECECTRCGRREVSDAILVKILALEAELGDPTTAAPKQMDKIKQLIELYQEDGLSALLDGPYGRLALAYTAAGEAEEAKKYAQLAVDVLSANSSIDEGNSEMRTWRAICKGSEIDNGFST